MVKMEKISVNAFLAVCGGYTGYTGPHNWYDCAISDELRGYAAVPDRANMLRGPDELRQWALEQRGVSLPASAPEKNGRQRGPADRQDASERQVIPLNR